jgi:hypothetical protein
VRFLVEKKPLLSGALWRMAAGVALALLLLAIVYAAVMLLNALNGIRV